MLPLLLRPAKVSHCGPRPCALVGAHRHDETSRKHYRSEAGIKPRRPAAPPAICSPYLAPPRRPTRRSPGKPGPAAQRSAPPAWPGPPRGGGGRPRRRPRRCCGPARPGPEAAAACPRCGSGRSRGRGRLWRTWEPRGAAKTLLRPTRAPVHLTVCNYIASKPVEMLAVRGSGQRLHVAAVQSEFRAAQPLGPDPRAVCQSLRVCPCPSPPARHTRLATPVSSPPSPHPPHQTAGLNK